MKRISDTWKVTKNESTNEYQVEKKWMQLYDRDDVLDLEGQGSFTIGDLGMALIKQFGVDFCATLGNTLLQRTEYMKIITEKARMTFTLPRTDDYKPTHVKITFKDECGDKKPVSDGWALEDFKSENPSKDRISAMCGKENGVRS